MEKPMRQVRRVLSFLDRLLIENNFKDKAEFVDRANNKENLVLILAGKKAELWKYVFPRIYADIDRDTDVVIANPGDLNPQIIRKVASDYGFSYLATKSRRLAPAMNIAIRNLSQAKWIYKVDDDIFINKGFFTSLKSTYQRVKKNDIYEPGMTVPLLNINNFSYYHFLQTLDLVEEYRAKFGPIKLNGTNSTFYRDGNAAAYIWSKSLPLSATAEVFAEKNQHKIAAAPFRFSISAIFFHRTLWERMGGFKVTAPGTLGGDEEAINKEVMVREPVSQIIVCLDTFAGHFGYYTHMKEMMEFFHKNEKAFAS